MKPFTITIDAENDISIQVNRFLEYHLGSNWDERFRAFKLTIYPNKDRIVIEAIEEISYG